MASHVGTRNCTPGCRRRPDGGMDVLAKEDEGLGHLLAEDHAETAALMAEQVGYTAMPLHSYFTYFAPDRALRTVAAAQAAALRPLLAELSEGNLPLLSATSPGKFGDRAGPGSYTDIPAGPVILRHLIDLQVFPNDLLAVVVSGAQLSEWIEMSAGLFRQVAAGTTGGMLVDSAMPGHDFDVIHGLTCKIDLSQPARFGPGGFPQRTGVGRVRDLRHRGKPVDPAQRFVVAVNSYRASGGGHVAVLRDAPHVALPRLSVRAALRDYLAGALPRDPIEEVPQPWSFVKMPGTRVIVRTGPGARSHFHELDGLGVETAGIDPDGFLRLILPL